MRWRKSHGFRCGLRLAGQRKAKKEEELGQAEPNDLNKLKGTETALIPHGGSNPCFQLLNESEGIGMRFRTVVDLLSASRWLLKCLGVLEERFPDAAKSQPEHGNHLEPDKRVAIKDHLIWEQTDLPGFQFQGQKKTLKAVASRFQEAPLRRSQRLLWVVINQTSPNLETCATKPTKYVMR